MGGAKCLGFFGVGLSSCRVGLGADHQVQGCFRLDGDEHRRTERGHTLERAIGQSELQRHTACTLARIWHLGVPPKSEKRAMTGIRWPVKNANLE